MSDEDVQHGNTDDYFDAVVVSDGIAIRMSDSVVEVLLDMTHRLLRLFEDGLVEDGGRFRRGRSAESVLHDMFPDAYRDRAEARSFRERHAGTLRDTAAIRRVRDRVAAGPTHVISEEEIDDWLHALGLGMFLFVRRNARKTNEVGWWISYIQSVLLFTINPRLRGVSH